MFEDFHITPTIKDGLYDIVGEPPATETIRFFDFDCVRLNHKQKDQLTSECDTNAWKVKALLKAKKHAQLIQEIVTTVATSSVAQLSSVHFPPDEKCVVTAKVCDAMVDLVYVSTILWPSHSNIYIK